MKQREKKRAGTRAVAKRPPVSAAPREDASAPAPEAPPGTVEIDYARLKERTGSFQLDNIVLMDSSYESHSDPRTLADTTGPSEFTVGITEARWSRYETHVDVVLAYEIKALRRTPAEARDLFAVNARFLATYFVPGGTPHLEVEVMADWVIANGQINVFPYLRQLVADLSTRGGWPTLVLRVHRAPKSRPRDLVQRTDATYPGVNV